MRYYTVITESGLVVNVVEAEDSGHALRLCRAAGETPMSLAAPCLIIVKDRPDRVTPWTAHVREALATGPRLDPAPRADPEAEGSYP